MTDQLSTRFRCILIAALTADGFIGRHGSDLSTRWTSREDAAFFKKISTQTKIVVMGQRTFETIGHGLKDRIIIVLTRHNLDGISSLDKAKKLEQDQVYSANLTVEELVTKLHQLGFNSLAVSGGASIYRQFMAAGLVNEMYLTIEPVLFGEGVRLFDRSFGPVESEQEGQTASTYLRLKLQEVIDLSPQTKVLHYLV